MYFNISRLRKVSGFALGLVVAAGCAVKATPYLWRSYFAETWSFDSHLVQLNTQGEIYDLELSGEYPLRKLSPQGVELWRVTVGGGSLYLHGDEAIIAGRPFKRLSSTGEEVWSRDILPAGAITRGVTVTDDGHIYVSFYTYSYPAGFGDTGVIALNADGNLLWTYTLAHTDDTDRYSMSGVIALASGELLTVTSGLNQYETHVFDSTGNLLQTHKFEEANFNGGRVYNDGDNVFVVSRDVVIRLNNDGTPQWSYDFNKTITCSTPAGAEIACYYEEQNLAEKVTRVAWINADGSLRTTATVDTFDVRELVYAGNNRWLLNDFVEPPQLSDSGSQPPLGFPYLHYANASGVAYPRVNVLDQNGAVLKKITLQPSTLNPEGCFGAFCSNMVYVTDGDGPVNVVANDSSVVAFGRTTMSRRVFVSAYDLN